jgi:hypothetical protein
VNIEKLIRDPVFQLNLILWMAKEQPEACFQVLPLFQQHGFSPFLIEQPFKFPVAVSRQIEGSPALSISKEPEPEVILSKPQDKKAIYFECKAQSFGPGSSNSRQARGHLLASGDAFADVYRPLEYCLLGYLVPDSDRGGMSECLTTLQGELSSGGFSPGQFSIHGLKVDGGSLFYTWGKRLAEHLGMPESQPDEIPVMENITPETNPSPLLLVYTDEDCPDRESRDYYRRILCEKLRAAMLCDLNQEHGELGIPLSSDGLLHNTTGGMFQYLGRKRQESLRNFVRDNIFDFIVQQWESKVPDLAKREGQTLTLAWGGAENKKNFLEWLEDRKAVFPAERITEVQMNITFDSADE